MRTSKIGSLRVNSQGNSISIETKEIAENGRMVSDANQLFSWPLSRTISRQPSQRATSTKPKKSNLRPHLSRSLRARLSVSGTLTSQDTRPGEIAPIGQLMKKIQFHDQVSVI